MKCTWTANALEREHNFLHVFKHTHAPHTHTHTHILLPSFGWYTIRRKRNNSICIVSFVTFGPSPIIINKDQFLGVQFYVYFIFCLHKINLVVIFASLFAKLNLSHSKGNRKQKSRLFNTHSIKQIKGKKRTIERKKHLPKKNGTIYIIIWMSCVS